MSHAKEHDALPHRPLLVIHSGTYGGPHNQAVYLSRALKAVGSQVVVVLPREGGGAFQRLCDEGIQVYEMDLRRPRANWKHYIPIRLLWDYPDQIRRLTKLIIEERIDLVVVHGLLNIDGAIAAKLAKKPVVWQLLDTRPPPWLRRILMPVVTRLADAIMFTGHSLYRQYPGAQSLGDRAIVFYPPVGPTKRENAELRGSVRRRYGCGDRDVLVASVGNLNPQKGHDVLIDAVLPMLRRDERLSVVIRGSVMPGHELYARSLSKAVPRSGLSGRLSVGALEPEETVEDLLAAADIFVLASRGRSEGIATVVLEAMSAGLPVIVSDVGAMQDVVTPSCGILTPPGDLESLRLNLRRLVDDRALRESLGAHGRDYANSIASPEAFVASQMDGFRLAGRGARVRQSLPARCAK